MSVVGSLGLILPLVPGFPLFGGMLIVGTVMELVVLFVGLWIIILMVPR
jgi:hypothetical protein